MNVNGARIYTEGVSIKGECEKKIEHIVSSIKALSPSSEVSMRFLKVGHTYEGLVWGSANNVPIGIYNRGPSMIHVLETLYRKVKKECLRIWKLTGNPRKRTAQM